MSTTGHYYNPDLRMEENRELAIRGGCGQALMPSVPIDVLARDFAFMLNQGFLALESIYHPVVNTAQRPLRVPVLEFTRDSDRSQGILVTNVADLEAEKSSLTTNSVGIRPLRSPVYDFRE
jgi:hypothetical protein